MTGVSSTFSSRKPSPKKRHTTNIEIDIKPEEDTPEDKDQSIVRSPPAGTKEKPDYKVDLEQARQIFEANSSSSRSGRSSRSSSASPRRRTPRSRSTPSPINRGRFSTSSSKSSSPARTSSRNSSPLNRGSPSPRSKSPKKFGDPDVVVLEHTEVNYYYEEDGTRLLSKSRDHSSNISEDMSNPDVVKPPPAGTKEEADYVPSISLRSVRDMFERSKEAEPAPIRREPAPKKPVTVKKPEPVSKSSEPPTEEHNTEIIRSTTAGEREEPEFQASIDLKSARSIFESPQKVENYVPRNKIKEREEEARRKRAAAAAASPRSSESSEASSTDVIRSVEAGSKEHPEYQVDLKATKKMFEGGRAPDPIKHESNINRPKRDEIKTEVIRPEPAGTKEVAQFEKSTDMLSAKQRFQNTGQETEAESKRKDPIDIQEEKRLVIQKEQEIKEESQQRSVVREDHETENVVTSPSRNITKISAVQLTLSSGKKPPDEYGSAEQGDKDFSIEAEQTNTSVTPERRHSVSSEDLEEKSGLEEEARERLKLESEDVQYAADQQPQSDIEADELEKTEANVEDRDSAEEESLKQESGKEQIAEHETGVEDSNEEESLTGQEQQEPAAAVVPVKVAIPDDLTTERQETDIAQEYSSYTKTLDYNEEVEHQQSSSDSESDNLQTSEQKEAPVTNGDAPSQNGYGEGESPIDDTNHTEEPLPSGKGVMDTDTTSTPANQQDITGNDNLKPEQVHKADPFGLGDIIGPPQLAPEQKHDPFADLGSLTSPPAPPPRGNKQKLGVNKPDTVNKSDDSSSSDDDADKPHFNYPFDDEDGRHKNAVSYTNGLDVFGVSNNSAPEIIPTKAAPVQNNTADLLGGFDPFSTPATAIQAQPVTSSNVGDPFDLFSAPANQDSTSTGTKDPFDLFA